MKVVMMFTLALMALATVSAKNATLSAKDTTVFFPQRSLPDFAFSKSGDMSQAYMVHNVVIKSGSTNVTLDTKMDHTGPDTRNVTTTDGAVVPSITIGQSVAVSGVTVSIEGGLFPEWCSLEYGESAVNNPDPKNDPNISDIHVRNGTYKWTYTVKDLPKPAVKGNATAQVMLTFTVTPPKEPSPSPSPPPMVPSPSPVPSGNNTGSPSPAPAGNNTASPSPSPAGNNTASPTVAPTSPTPVPNSPKPSPNATRILSASRRLLSLDDNADVASPVPSPVPSGNHTASPSPVAPSPPPAGNNTASPSPAPAGNNTASPSPSPAGNNTASPSPSKLPPVASPTPFPPVTPAADTQIDDVILGLPKAAIVDGKEVDCTVVASQVGASYQVTVTVPWGKTIVYDPTLRYKTTSPDVERVALLVIGDVGSFPFDDFINRLAHALELDQYDARRARLMAVALTSSSSSLSLLSASAAAAAASPSPVAPSGQKYIKLASAKNAGQKNRLTIILDIYSAPHQSALESIERLNTLASSAAAKKNFGLQDMISVTDEPNPSPSPNPSPDKGGLKTWQWAAIIGGGAFVIAVLIGVCACRGKKEAKEEFHRIP